MEDFLPYSTLQKYLRTKFKLKLKHEVTSIRGKAKESHFVVKGKGVEEIFDRIQDVDSYYRKLLAA